VGGLDLTKAEEDRARKWSLRIAILSLVLTSVFSAANFGYQLWRDRSIKKSTDTRFGNIESVLRLLTATVAPQLQKAVDDSLVSAISAKTNSDARNSLEFAGAALHQLRDSKVAFNPTEATETIRHLDQVIQKHQNIPETWRVVGEFISYRSQITETFEQLGLPLCTKMATTFTGTVENGPTEGSEKITHGPVEFHDCKIMLDSPEATFHLSFNLSLSHVIFRHSVVFYGGEEIRIVPMKVARDTPAAIIGQLAFTDCLFVFSLPGIPNMQGQKLVLAVLESPPNYVQVDLGGDLSGANQFRNGPNVIR
jgi:hypothetical protein